MFLTVKDVSHVYFSKDGYKVILENVSLKMEQGEFVTFLGPSGCGKTTLLSIIAGLLKQTQGTVFLENQEVMGPTSKTGYMLQADYLFPWRTIKENILLGNEIHGERTPLKEQEALALLEQVNLHGIENDYPRQLSGGMRQRASLVRTLMTNPTLLLLDEPFSALDYQTKLKLEELVFTMLKTYEKSALLVTHDIEEAIAMSDRIYLFQRNPGKIAKIFVIPEEIRSLAPLEARKHPRFTEIFDEIWKEMENLE